MALEASSWELRVALLFVDISGFTNLCTRLDIDCLQRHINTYFTQLIDIVVARGGDVLRFAGDAIFCSWSLAPHAADEDLALATAAACACSLELNRKCAVYPIPEIAAELSIHSGVGAGPVHAFRVGGAERWEFLLAGDVCRQVAEAEVHAAKVETVVSPEAWRLVCAHYEGEPRGEWAGGEGPVLLGGLRAATHDPGERGVSAALSECLVAYELLQLQIGRASCRERV